MLGMDQQRKPNWDLCGSFSYFSRLPFRTGSDYLNIWYFLLAHSQPVCTPKACWLQHSRIPPSPGECKEEIDSLQAHMEVGTRRAFLVENVRGYSPDALSHWKEEPKRHCLKHHSHNNTCQDPQTKNPESTAEIWGKHDNNKKTFGPKKDRSWRRKTPSCATTLDYRSSPPNSRQRSMGWQVAGVSMYAQRFEGIDGYKNQCLWYFTIVFRATRTVPLCSLFLQMAFGCLFCCAQTI